MLTAVLSEQHAGKNVDGDKHTSLYQKCDWNCSGTPLTSAKPTADTDPGPVLQPINMLFCWHLKDELDSVAGIQEFFFFFIFKENKRQEQGDVYIQIFFIKNYNNSQFIGNYSTYLNVVNIY